MKTSWKKQFITLWIGQATSVFTSSVVQMALIWYITDTTNSAAMLTLATLVGFVPRAVIGMFGGVYIDRHNKKNIMIGADSFIAVLCLAILFAGEALAVPIWLVMLVLFGRSVGAAFHEPTLQSVTPLIVPKEYLTQYAGYAQAFESISDLLSPAAAAILYAALPIHRIMLLDVAGAVIAITMLLFVSIPKVQKNRNHRNTGFCREFMEGVHALRMAHGMTMLMIVSALYAIIYAPIGTLFPLVSISHFGMGVNGSALVETVFAAGTLAGSFLLGLYGQKIRKVPAISLSIGLYGLGTLVTGLLPHDGFALFVVIAGFMGITIPFYYGVRTSMLQMSFDTDVLGRIMSLSMSLTRMAMPVGLILAGTFAETIGVDRWFVISGILALVLSVFVWNTQALKGCCDVPFSDAQ